MSKELDCIYELEVTTKLRETNISNAQEQNIMFRAAIYRASKVTLFASTIILKNISTNISTPCTHCLVDNIPHSLEHIHL